MPERAQVVGHNLLRKVPLKDVLDATGHVAKLPMRERAQVLMQVRDGSELLAREMRHRGVEVAVDGREVVPYVGRGPSRLAHRREPGERAELGERRGEDRLRRLVIRLRGSWRADRGGRHDAHFPRDKGKGNSTRGVLAVGLPYPRRQSAANEEIVGESRDHNGARCYEQTHPCALPASVVESAVMRRSSGRISCAACSIPADNQRPSGVCATPTQHDAQVVSALAHQHSRVVLRATPSPNTRGNPTPRAELPGH